MKKRLSRRLRHWMTMLALFLLLLHAVACGTPEVGMEHTAREVAAAAPIEILVTGDMDAQALQPAHATNATLGDRIQLLGYDFRLTGQALNVALYWQAKEPVDKSYSVFLHVFDSQGKLQGQSDSPPVSGDYPTSSWQPGEVVVDGHTVPLPSDAPQGTYRVVVGMYDNATKERLSVLDGTGQKVPEGKIILTTALPAQTTCVATSTITSQPISRSTPIPDRPPQTLSFTASPNLVERGGTVTLTWNAPRATSVGLTRLSPEGDIFVETEALHLPASGSIALLVPEEYTESVKYYLGARDANGVLHKAYITVGVICRYDEYVAPRCPLAQDTIWAAYEPFERGYMVWRSDTREIYVLYADGSYETHEDIWQEGEPVDIQAAPPPGLHVPVRGFGNLYAHQPHIRAGLGWATEPEAGYTMGVETIRGGSGRYPATSVYFTLPDNRVVNLYPFTSTWEIIP
jgi:hypothetical protein